MALTYGTATFTNGQQAVTSVSLDSGTLTYFQAGTEIAVGANPQIATVEAQKATGASSFNLKEPWAYASGTYAFLASNTSEAFANGVQAAKGFQDALQSAVDGQGTAAAADVQTSTTDSTAGRVMAVGAFGLGGASLRNGDANNTDVKTGFTHTLGSLGDVGGPATANVSILNIIRDNTSRRSQVAFDPSPNNTRAWLRGYSDAWGDWKEIWHEGNFVFAANVSGTTIANNSNVSGSGLTPAQEGTWKNVSGYSAGSGSYRLWQKV